MRARIVSGLLRLNRLNHKKYGDKLELDGNIRVEQPFFPDVK